MVCLTNTEKIFEGKMMRRKSKSRGSNLSFWLIVIIIVAVVIFGKGRTPNNVGQSAQDIKVVNHDNLVNLQFNIHKYPQNYAILLNNQPNFSVNTKRQITRMQQERLQYLQAGNDQQETNYRGFDSLGRTREVSSFVRYKDVVKHSSRVMQRPSFSPAAKISGEYADGHYDAQQQRWSGTRSNNRIVQLSGYRGYIYNKSHLLAWSLGGSMDSDNIVLGTRAQNVGTNNNNDPGGMAYAETKVRNFLYNHQDEVVFYKAIPEYVGNELVPRGVQVQAQSIKDPKALTINVWTFNTQAGAAINYTTGQANTQ